MAEGWRVVAGVLARAGAAASVTAAAMAAARVGTARDILIFIEGRIPFLRVNPESV
jgi:hypothetical protein